MCLLVNINPYLIKSFSSKGRDASRLQKKKPGQKKSADTTNRVEQPSAPQFAIVGFGASAGGLEAFSKLLSQLKPDLGMAYVLVMHLSPNHKSALTEILQTKTKIPVHTVKDGMKVHTDNLYVIPPNTFMSVVDGHLKLAPRSITSLGNFAIDYFLRTLAEVYQHKAVGVILSGTASDGTLGLKAIKSYGGITFAQDTSAKFNGMPRNAAESGFVDYVLPPEKIAKELQRLSKTYTVLPPEKIEEVQTGTPDHDALKKILAVVKNKCGTDFDLHYKKASIYRRVVRRMALNKCDSLRSYLILVSRNEKEVDLLYDDFLINVTNFFRDPEFYKVLNERALPALLKGRAQADPLRIWVAGCSTGEEVFSIAICVMEFLEKKKNFLPIQIFGSDLDGQALVKARTGIYSLSSLAGVNSKWLEKYFKKLDGNYQVVRQLRELCVFSQHNLLSDPPFSRMDIISCQNVLIYMEPKPQKRILQTFHFALKPPGFLFLGKSETTSAASDLFEFIDKRVKVFTRKATRTQQIDFIVQPVIGSPGRVPVIERRSDQEFEKEITKIMLSRFVLPTVLIDKNLAIVQFFGATLPYLSPGTGRATLNILKMIREDLLIELRTAIQKVQKSGAPASTADIVTRNKKIALTLSIEVIPYFTTSNEAFYLVIFKERPIDSGDSVQRKPEVAKANSDLVKLEQELMQSREIIRTTTEEYESTYEELQTNNEMILSSNEELQSVNEELETSKEELQSANEELTTINEELNKRNIDLKESQSFAEAIIQTVHSPLLVLTINLQIRMANLAFYNTFRLAPELTVGTFLYDLGHGSWDIGALREHFKDVFPKKTSFKDFEIKHTFPGIGEKILIINAYKLEKTEGIKETLILLSFDDVTRRLNAETSLLKAQEQLKLSLIGDTIGTWSWDLQTNSMKWSRQNELLNGIKEGTFNGVYADWENLIDTGDLPYVQKTLARNIRDGSPVEIEYRIRKADRSVSWILSKGHVYYGEDQKPERMIGVSIDITERRMQSDALELKVSQRTAELQAAVEDIKRVNQQLEEFAFISSHDLQEPLRKITTFASLLGRPEAALNEYAGKYVSKMQSSTEKMSLLLRGLLSYANLLKSEGKGKSQVDLNNILDKVEKFYDRQIKATSAVMERSGLGSITAVPDQIFQLFCHLVGNALKFSKDHPHVRVSASRLDHREVKVYPQLDQSKEYIIVDIIDNGVGFEQKYAHKIFQLFQRLDARKGVGGTGLGLAICKKIVEDHNGTIFAAGILNAGATFTFILPVD